MSKPARKVVSQPELAGMDSDALLKRCRDQQPDATHESFCLELFRRAIAGEDRECWGILYETYKGLVCHWVLRYAHRQGWEVDDLDGVVVDALLTFWDAFTIDKFRKAQGLAPVLTYLKACTATAVQQALRVQTRDDNHQDPRTLQAFTGVPEPAEQQPEAVFDHQFEAQRLWAIVRQACNDENDLLLAELSFSMDLKPSEITERYAETFPDVADVYARLRNLRNRLKRHEDLRQLWTKND